ncbi:Scr1 family TA system antitoxin-like transcriptional regulator [Streptomyces sp. NPDC092046]|uniref:Scr1 family TA system antitoxin-like transcriptional regulator n=1 Tax=Streptomyces sp. NPDC092046 TaxID=3366009 RepID=UPI0037F9051B
MSDRGSAGAAGRMQIAHILDRLMGDQRQTQVAKAAGVSVGTINRYLSWRDASRLRVSTVIAIAAACGASEDERDYLAHLVRMQDDGWWTTGNLRADSLLDPLLSFEAVADTELVYANALVPGLLQTADYAESLHREQDPGAEPAVVASRIASRLRRQTVLDGHLRLSVVLDQSVLHRTVGSAATMAAQIEHLIAMAARPAIDLRVLPLTAGAPAGSGGHFLTLDWQDDGRELSVVYVELHRRRGLYLDDPAEVEAYRSLFHDLHRRAADTTATQALLTHARSEYDA